MIAVYSAGGKAFEFPSWSVWLIVGLILAIIITFYALRSTALYKMARNVGMKYDWLAFVPVVWIVVACKLSGNIIFFGAKLKRAWLIFLVVFGITTTVGLVQGLMTYVPLIGYYLEGGRVAFNVSNQVFDGLVFYPFDNYFMVGADFSTAYTQGYITALNVLYYVTWANDIINFFLMLSLFSAFFRTYWPQRPFVGVILSVFGMFPIAAFVVRKNQPVDYAKYIRERMRVYNEVNRQSLNGQNGGENSQPFDEYEKNGEPFDEYQKGNGKSDDPFSDFFDDKKD